MNISIQEKLMYDVMKAIYENNTPINFKGSMVLKAYLVEAGYLEETRHTVDIDANWYSDSQPTIEEMANALQTAVSKNEIKLKVTAYRMYGEGRSAGFEFIDCDSNEIIFTMDIDVNRPKVQTKIYEIEGICFNGVAPIQILSDKINVLSSDKIFRRIKDLIDLYYISHVIKFDKHVVFETLKNSKKELGNFNAFLYRVDELKHSYDKFRFAGEVNKPSFGEIYNVVKIYIKDILPKH